MEKFMVRIYPIEITAEEFELLQSLTVKAKGDAKAIFSTNPSKDLWPSTRAGRTPFNEREDVAGRTTVLDQLAKCLRWHRENGGRLLVKEDGAYWREGSVNNTIDVQFARWEWIGEPPKPKEVPMPTCAVPTSTYQEFKARVAETRRLGKLK
jgi:hypothetical protein